MSKVDQIKNDLNIISGILQTALECFYSSKYLYNPKTQKEKNFVDNSGQFSFIRHILWRNSIIEINKLTSSSKNDKYSIFKLVDKLKNDGYYRSVNFSSDILNDIEEKLKNNVEVITKVNYLRSKLYSHRDREINNSFDNLDISFEDVENLIYDIIAIIKILYNEILDADYHKIESILFQKGFKSIYILAEKKQKSKDEKLKKFLKEVNKNKNI